jgi:transcriptional regulator with XRE-family HTH domain
MSQIARNLTRRREILGMTVPDVHKALSALGVDVAESTVFGWFNGARGVRKMEHLRALCTILQTDMNALAGDEAEIAEGPLKATIAREIAQLDEVQQQLVLALVRSLRKPDSASP